MRTVSNLTADLEALSSQIEARKISPPDAALRAAKISEEAGYCAMRAGEKVKPFFVEIGAAALDVMHAARRVGWTDSDSPEDAEPKD